jgi:hypothetical protein
MIAVMHWIYGVIRLYDRNRHRKKFNWTGSILQTWTELQLNDNSPLKCSFCRGLNKRQFESEALNWLVARVSNQQKCNNNVKNKPLNKHFKLQSCRVNSRETLTVRSRSYRPHENHKIFSVLRCHRRVRRKKPVLVYWGKTSSCPPDNTIFSYCRRLLIILTNNIIHIENKTKLTLNS